MMYYNIAVLLLIIFHGDKVHLSDIMDINDKICLPEVTVCNDTFINLEENRTLSNISYNSNINVACPDNHNVILTKLTMEISTSSNCSIPGNTTCTLDENQLGSNGLMDYPQSKACPFGKQCTTTVTYTVPDRQFLQKFCGVEVVEALSLSIQPLVKLIQQYQCQQFCANVQSPQAFYSNWHTLEKNCSSEIAVFFSIHLLVSHYEVVDSLLQLVVSGTSVSAVEKGLQDIAKSGITSGYYCEIDIYKNSEVAIGNARYINTVLNSYPVKGSVSEPCSQRLRIQGESMNYTICAGNTSFYLYEITGDTAKKYWLFYESDDVDVKVIFYLIVEVFVGKFMVTCGYKSCDNTDGPGVVKVTANETTVTESIGRNKDDSDLNLATIIVVCSVAAAVVVIALAVLTGIIVWKWRYTKATRDSAYSNGDTVSTNKQVYPGAEGSTYNEIEEMKMSNPRELNISGVQSH